MRGRGKQGLTCDTVETAPTPNIGAPLAVKLERCRIAPSIGGSMPENSGSRRVGEGGRGSVSGGLAEGPSQEGHIHVPAWRGEEVGKGGRGG